MVDKIILAGKQSELEALIPQIIAIKQMLDQFQSSQETRLDPVAPERAFKPMVLLHFIQDSTKVQEEYRPVEGEISFRLMDVNFSPSTPGQQVAEMPQVIALAKRIKSLFAKPPFIWKKGKEMVSYTDWEQGYQFQVACLNKVAGKALIEQVLDIRGRSPDWENANHITSEAPDKRYPIIPDKRIILGQSVKMPRQRPVADVIFRRASLHVHGLKPIILIDLSGRSADPVVDAD